jgi:lipoic acid synthetase
VTRDDLPDGGAGHFADTVRRIRSLSPAAVVETLIPDFSGREDAVRAVLDSGVHVLNHNLETVPRLYREVRPGADFERSLNLLRLVRRENPRCIAKSGLMAGLGETRKELVAAIERIAETGCEALTVGQYLRPSKSKIPVREYLTPADFESIRVAALRAGFRRVMAGPFVRSSYQADELISP